MPSTIHHPQIAIVVAMAKNNVIGGENSLVWRLPADLAHFKKLTMGHPIIMGRKTFQSIGRALPGRRTIVVSRNPDFEAGSAEVVGSLEEAMAAAGQTDTIFICGGGQIFHQAIDQATMLYLTEVDCQPDGDVFFHYRPDQWQEVSREEHARDERNDYSYTFRTLRRIKD